MDQGWRGLLTGRGLAQLALITFGVGLHAFNEFAIAAALPLALDEVGGLERINQVFGLYFIGSIAGGITGAPLRRRLGGRNALLLAGGLFLVGMGLCIGAGSAGGLILGRGLQGLADGAILAIAYGLIPEVFPAALVPRIFSVEAVVWAVAALTGPLAGGAAAGVSWRLSMAVAAPLVALFLLLVPFVAPVGKGSGRGAAGQAVPVVLCLGAAFLLVLPSSLVGVLLPVLALGGGLVLLRLAVAVDERLPHRLFPTGAFRPGTQIGRAMWVLVLMPCASAAELVYLALAVGKVTGLGPTGVGYVMIAGPLAWSAAAIPAGGLVRHLGLLVRLGPALVAVGLVVSGCGLANGVLPLVLAGELLRGAGFGLAWGALHARVMTSAVAGEADRAASILPAVTTGGSALGAGLGGALAASVGLVPALEAGTAGGAVLAVWLAAAALALAALAMAWPLGRGDQAPASPLTANTA